MTRLGVAFAENPALTPHWRDLVDGTRGTCVVVDGKAGTVEVAGPERLEISIAGQRYAADPDAPIRFDPRSEEHTSELQSLMRISYAVFCLKKKKQTSTHEIQ